MNEILFSNGEDSVSFSAQESFAFRRTGESSDDVEVNLGIIIQSSVRSMGTILSSVRLAPLELSFIVKRSDPTTAAIGPAIRRRIEEWEAWDAHVPLYVQEFLICHICYSCSGAIRTLHPNCNRFWLNYRIGVDLNVDSETEAVLQSMDDDAVVMVRAEESAIAAALKSTTAASSIMDSCPICLEEYADDAEGFEMPCRHFFHKECITKWLSVGHSCPCCRLELPTDA